VSDIRADFNSYYKRWIRLSLIWPFFSSLASAAVHLDLLCEEFFFHKLPYYTSSYSDILSISKHHSVLFVLGVLLFNLTLLAREEVSLAVTLNTELNHVWWSPSSHPCLLDGFWGVVETLVCVVHDTRFRSKTKDLR
jgi:hypothetical protein